MWRKATKFDILRKATATRGLKRSSCIEYLKELSQDSIEIKHFSSRIETNQGYKGFGRNCEVLSQIGEVGRYNFMISRTPFGTSGVNNQAVRHYATAAAEPIVSTSSEEDEEIRELISKTSKQQRKHLVHGIPVWKYNALKKRQIQVETEAWNDALREYQELLSDMCEKKLAPNLPYVKSLFLGWFEPLRDAIKVEQDLCKNKNTGHAPYFDVLPADMMAVITMHKLMGLLMSSGGHGTATLVRAAVQIGEAIEHEGKLRKLLGKSKKKSTPKDAAAMEQELLGKKVTNLMKKKKGHLVKRILKEHDNSSPWGQDNQAKVGSRLIQLLIETAYIQPPADQLSDTLLDIRPAFIHTKRFFANDDQKGGRKYGVIECDPMVRKGLENSARHTVIPYMPMLVPPLDWRGYDKGAYLFLPSYIMRSRGARQQRQALKKAPQQQLEKVYKALNILGNTKWRVNKKVLSIIERIWASGGGLADLVDRQDLAIPEEPDTDEETAIRNWKCEVRNVRKENKERHSQRCDVELKLKVARTLKDEEGFYYPHNLDFRGRAYPLHPHLNHLGSDLCRGILEFAEGRPLRASGLRWLKIHMANLYAGGVDKLSHEGRAAFTENHLDDIFDSADRPLEGKRWWLQAEDPFQCLAACMNLTEALRSSSPEDYVSHMPVHQDGSCNGLQHYAALGRDKLGAMAVNLVAGDKPADVYSNIAKSVHEMMLRDAEKDPSIEPNVSRAKLLLNQVDRKLVKQTVMTSVYGVTYMGARDQLKKRLKERGAIADDNEVFGAACYAAKVTLTALEEMFEAARSIMNWLGECAKVIASENKTVQWTTPIGLPVVQPYRKIGKHMVSTSLQTLTLERETDKILRRRQRTAFPPNFVHSLDGTHMMMTAIACNESGLNFAGVHDSYWTHACDVDEMNKILREKFVELYDQPILEMLLDSFEKSLPHVTFPPLPERGDFDIRNVLDSRYFFN